jgi:hypothetical protein
LQINGSNFASGNHIQAETVWRYVNELKNFKGEVITNPPESLSYFFDSVAMNRPGSSDLTRDAEVDLARFCSIRLNSKVIYDTRIEPNHTVTAVEIYEKLKTAFSDHKTARNCSQLLTQATFAEPAIFFTSKFSHIPLKFSITSQYTTDIVVNTLDANEQPLDNVSLFFHLILAIQDQSNIDEVESGDQLPIQGFSVITREIVIPRESLSQKATKGASIKDHYSMFFDTKEEAFNYLHQLIEKENILPVSEYSYFGCIIA